MGVRLATSHSLSLCAKSPHVTLAASSIQWLTMLTTNSLFRNFRSAYFFPKCMETTWLADSPLALWEGGSLLLTVMFPICGRQASRQSVNHLSHVDLRLGHPQLQKGTPRYGKIPFVGQLCTVLCTYGGRYVDHWSQHQAVWVQSCVMVWARMWRTLCQPGDI